MHLNALPSSTRRVLERTQSIPELQRRLLIGGTAMSLHVGHREREDRDFVPFGSQLDRGLIGRILEGISGRDHARLITSKVARQAFLNEGFEIDHVH